MLAAHDNHEVDLGELVSQIFRDTLATESMINQNNMVLPIVLVFGDLLRL